MKPLVLLAVITMSLTFSVKTFAQNDPNLDKEKRETIQRIINDEQRRLNAGNTNAKAEANSAISTINNSTSAEQIHRAEKHYNTGTPQEVQANRRPGTAVKAY